VAHRLAVVTTGATFVLILFGGLVTNSGAALAVPDWPTTFGHNMLVYPWSRMVGGIFYEHSHRLLGAAVGLLTLALATGLWTAAPPLRGLGLAAAATVCVQGLLGGLRVVLLRDTLAIVHGCVAHAFLALVVTIAFLTSRAAASPGARVDRALWRWTLAAVALVYLQIVFGALLTHAGRVDLHLATAVVIFVIIPRVALRWQRSGDAVAAPASRWLLALLALQLILGVGSFLARFSSLWIPGEQITVLALPVAHRLVAGLIFAAVVVLAVRARTAHPEAHREVEERHGFAGTLRAQGGMGGPFEAPHLPR
jgi:cytochrome c oxidase assembly protein subunit 15